MYKAVIFDFDGTIADTMSQNYEAWEYALGLYSFALDQNTYFVEEGKTPKAIVSSFTNNTKIVEEIIKLKDEYFIKNYELKIYDGAYSLLEILRSSKKIALVTGGGQKRIEYILKKADLYKYFDVIVTANDVTKGKPDKQPYEKALKLLSLEAQECVVVENAPMGIMSAKSAGIYCVAMETTLPKQYLNLADIIVSDFKQLINLKIL